MQTPHRYANHWSFQRIHCAFPHTQRFRSHLFGEAVLRQTLAGLHCELRAKSVGIVRSSDGLHESLNSKNRSLVDASQKTSKSEV
jgi:hypothetical protein